jgi:hypothetical protein
LRVRFTSIQLWFSFLLFSSLPYSSYPFEYLICHIWYFQKMQHAWTVCIPSGRCFMEQKGVLSESGIFWAG